jgi:membrane-associated protease RseP (regulator of RpoE activity)
MVPLDGGYIFKEAVDGLLRRRGLLKYSAYIVSTVSFALLAMMLGLIALPYLLHI